MSSQTSGARQHGEETPLLALTAVSSQLVVDAAKAEVRVIGQAVDQFERRTYARTVMSFIEGVNYCQARVAQRHEGLSREARLRARAATCAERARAREAQEASRVATRMRTAFAAFAAAYEVGNPLDTRGSEWEDFRHCIRIRNRITHPRSGKDCQVTDDDVSLVRRVHAWYLALSGELVASVPAAGLAPSTPP